MLEQYPEIKDFLETITADFEIIFGNNLLGVYLTGSLTTNSYSEKLSDIDLIVVLNTYITSQEKDDLDAWSREVNATQPIAKHLDTAFIDKESVRSIDGKTQSKGLEFWKGEITESNNTLGDNLLVWKAILQNGIKLYGIDPHDIINDIPNDHLRNVMLKELKRLKELMNEVFKSDIKFRYYVVTTLCRMQYTNQTKGFVSKKDALEWYSGETGNYKSLMNAAIQYIEGNEEPISQTEKQEYLQFIEETENLIRNSASDIINKCYLK